MHIHGMQNNAAFAANALDAMQRAQAAQRAQETRDKLFEFASQLEAEDCIVTLGEQQEDDSRQQNGKRKKHGNAESGPQEETAEPQISDWA